MAHTLKVGTAFLLATSVLTISSGATRSNTLQRPRNRRVTKGLVAVTVNAPVQELLTAYVHWLAAQPATSSKPKPLMPAPSGGHLQGGQTASQQTPGIIHMPSLDLYAASGISLYHSEDPQKNPAFIQDLPSNLTKLGGKPDEVRPTLKEAIGMFTELKPYQSAILASERDTIFALTFPADVARCQGQDMAVKQLKGRAREIGLNVIEVRLHN